MIGRRSSFHIGLLWALVATMAILWLMPDEPVVDLGGDAVEPRVVERGGKVTITRSWRMTRDQDMTVHRAMVQGDCAKHCEMLDLTTSVIHLKAGDYVGVRREHTIPRRAAPGFWELRFAWHWTDKFGRARSMALAPLTIEITDRPER